MSEKQPPKGPSGPEKPKPGRNGNVNPFKTVNEQGSDQEVFDVPINVDLTISEGDGSSGGSGASGPDADSSGYGGGGDDGNGSKSGLGRDSGSRGEDEGNDQNSKDDKGSNSKKDKDGGSEGKGKKSLADKFSDAVGGGKDKETGDGKPSISGLPGSGAGAGSSAGAGAAAGSAAGATGGAGASGATGGIDPAKLAQDMAKEERATGKARVAAQAAAAQQELPGAAERQRRNADEDKEKLSGAEQDVANIADGAAALAARSGEPISMAINALLQTKAGQWLKRKLAKRTVRIISLLVTIIGGGLLFIFGLLLGPNLDPGSLQAFEEDINMELLGEDYYRSYREAAALYNIPWSTLASVAQTTTYHGRINPYIRNVPSIRGNTEFFSGELQDGGTVYVYADHTFEREFDSSSLDVDVSFVIHKETDLTANRVLELVQNNDQIEEGDAVVVILGFADMVSVRIQDGEVVYTTKEVSEFGVSVNQITATLERKGVRTIWAGMPMLNYPQTGYHHRFNDELRAIEQGRIGLLVGTWSPLTTVSASRSEGAPGPGGAEITAPGDTFEELFEQALDNLVHSTNQQRRLNMVMSLLDPTSEQSRQRGVVSFERSGHCITLTTPIHGEGTGTGHGIFMLVPDELDRAGVSWTEDQLQNSCEAAEILAEVVAQTAEVVAQERETVYPTNIIRLSMLAERGDEEAQTEVEYFWWDVLNQLTVIGEPISGDCVPPARAAYGAETWVGVAVHNIWECILYQEEFEISRYSPQNRTVPVSSPADIKTVSTEALTVSWYSSNWDEAGCGNEHEGLFPISSRDWNSIQNDLPNVLQGRDRCDPVANITAAALLYTQESQHSGGNRPEPGQGWEALDSVLGTNAQISRLREEGPWRLPEVSDQCLNQVYGELVNYVENTHTELHNYSIGAVRDGNAPTTAHLEEVWPDLLETIQNGVGTCSTESWDDTHWGAVVDLAYNTLYTVELDNIIDETAAGVQETPEARGSDTTGQARGREYSPSGAEAGADQQVAYGDVLQMITNYALEISFGEFVERKLGETPLLQEYSVFRLQPDTRPYVPVVSIGDDDRVDQWMRLSISSYGGLYRGGQRTILPDGEIGMLNESVTYSALFNDIGLSYGVDPRLLAAVAHYESDFDVNKNCNSTNGPYGMFQWENLRTAEAQEACGDPTRQIELVAEYLQVLYEQAQSWEGAVWAYAAGGTSAAAQYRAVNGDLDGLRRYLNLLIPGNNSRINEIMGYIELSEPLPDPEDLAEGEEMPEPPPPTLLDLWYMYKEENPDLQYTSAVSTVWNEFARGEGRGNVQVTTIRAPGGNITVAVSIARNVKALVDAAEADGIRFGGWGYRSYDRQVELRRQNCSNVIRTERDVFTIPSGQCRIPTAIPGRSQHEIGLAVDFYTVRDGERHSVSAGNEAHRWLVRNAHRYGLRPFAREPWHWSTSGR